MDKLQGSWIATINVLDSSGNPTTLYYSDNGHKDSQGRLYHGRMKQPAKISVGVNDGGLVKNVTGKSSIGEIELENVDGGLNHLADYYLDGRECVLQFVSANKVITTWFKGIVTRINYRGNSIFLTLKSFSESLDLPLTQARYTGSGGVEGLPTDIMGNVKPKVFGYVYNATPVLCYANIDLFQVSDLTTTVIDNVYDKGVKLTKSHNCTSLAELIADNVASGEYHYYQGYFKVGDHQYQQITCDAHNSSAFKAGDVFNQICSAIQFSSGQRTIAEQPALIDSLINKYQCSGSTSTVIDMVYTDGVKLANGGSYASLSNLNTTAPTKGSFKTYQNYIRIEPPDSTEYPYNPIPLGSVTCDFTDSVVDYTSAKSVNVATTAITNLNNVSTNGIGLYIDNETSIRSILDTIVQSVGGFWWFGDSMESTAYEINADIYSRATGTYDIDLKNYQIVSADRNAVGVGENGLPYYSILASYAKIETVQKDVLGATTSARKAMVFQEYLKKESFDNVVKQKHPQSTRGQLISTLNNTTDMTAVTDRLLDYFKRRCDTLTVTANFSTLPEIKINQIVLVKFSRLGYNAGVKFRLMSYEMDIKRKSVTMTLMGYEL